jgi:hypothetical protein
VAPSQPVGLLAKLRARRAAYKRAQGIEAIHLSTRVDTERMRDVLVAELGYNHADVTKKLWETLPGPHGETDWTAVKASGRDGLCTEGVLGLTEQIPRGLSTNRWIMHTTQKPAFGSVQGAHNLLTQQPVPALETWVFIDEGASVPMPKGSVAYVCGQNGLTLIEAIEDGHLHGPINCAVVERDVWDKAVSAKKDTGRTKLKWMGGVAAVSLANLLVVFLTIPPGGSVLLAVSLVGLLYSAGYSIVFWTEGQIATATTTSVPLPKRKQDPESSGGGDDGGLAALYVLAHNGHLDTDAIDTDGGSSGGAGGDSDGGGDGGGGGD